MVLENKNKVKYTHTLNYGKIIVLDSRAKNKKVPIKRMPLKALLASYRVKYFP